MKFCKYCGTELIPDTNCCPNCGTVIRASGSDASGSDSSASDSVAEGFEKVKDAVGTVYQRAGSFASGLLEKVGAKKDKKAAETQLAETGQASKTLLPVEQRTKYMSATELWSWLKQSAKRQLFYTDEASELTEDEFVYKVNDRMAKNGVPASIRKKEVRWDRSNVTRQVYYVTPDIPVINPFTYLIQFNHVGKFTFVEEKTFITPPDLPILQKKKPLDMDAIKIAVIMIIFGVLLCAGGVGAMFESFLLGLILAVVGGLLIYFGVKKLKKNEELRAHNAMCDRLEVEWAVMWKNWEDTIFVHSFQEDINGQLSRIYDSVFECVKQVSNEEFDSANKVEQEERSNVSELEEMIARRKNEYR